MALNFDVTNDYISVPNSTSINFGTGSFGIAFWMYSIATTTQDIINKNRATATSTTTGYGFTISSVAATGYSFHMGNGTTYNRIDTGADASRGGSIWTHVLINVDRSTNHCIIYLNGTLKVDGALTLTGSTTSTTQMCLGANYSPSRYFSGYLSEVVFMNRIFTSEEIAKLSMGTATIKYYPLILSPNAYWPLDEWGSGVVSSGIGTVRDWSSNANNGTPNGAQTGVTEYISYKTLLFGQTSSSWLGTWENRIKLTVDKSVVLEDLTDFPVMVFLATSTGKTSFDVSEIFDELTSDANRKKIAITTSDGITQCYVEIVSWDDANERAWLFFKAPSLSSSVDTVFYLYYDIAQSDNTTYVGDKRSTPAEAVWSSNYVAAWHLEEETGYYLDSTSNHNDSIDDLVVSRGNYVSKVIGKCPEMSNTPSTGSVKHIGVGDNDSMDFSTNSFTIMARINSPAATHNTDCDIIRKGSTGTSTNSWWKMEWGDDTGANNDRIHFLIRVSGTDYANNTNIVAPDGAFHNQVMVRDTSTTKLLGYWDGNNIVDRAGSNGSCDNDSDVGISSKDTWNDDPFNGYYDEARLSNVTRSANYIKTEWNSDNNSLITFSDDVDITTKLYNSTLY